MTIKDLNRCGECEKFPLLDKNAFENMELPDPLNGKLQEELRPMTKGEAEIAAGIDEYFASEPPEVDDKIRHMKEVIYPKPAHEQCNTSEKCPACGSEMNYRQIACPDLKPGCCVMHYGFRCLSCGKVFQ